MSAIILGFGPHTPQIAETAWVAPNATLIGQVTLHENSSVFFGAVLRADNDKITIGEGSNIQDNVAVHTDHNVPTTVGKNVSVGHNAVLHGCTVEDDCLIGMGAIVLNRAIIGHGSLIAAGAVVLEDTVIPPNSLVAGVPAKVRRELTEDERQAVIQNATGYVTLSEHYRNGNSSHL